MIRLLITDDHPIVKDGIETILAGQNDIKLVAYVADGQYLPETLEKTPADVILMDINMPGMNGIEATQLVRKQFPHVKILCFSQYNERRFVRQVLNKGAHGYLLKIAASDKLVKAIKTVYKGDIYLSEDLPNIFDERPKRKSRFMVTKLTKRELDVLNQICAEKNNQEIADSLDLSHNTIETHRANLLLKVGVKNTAGLVKWAVQNQII